MALYDDLPAAVVPLNQRIAAAPALLFPSRTNPEIVPFGPYPESSSESIVGASSHTGSDKDQVNGIVQVWMILLYGDDQLSL